MRFISYQHIFWIIIIPPLASFCYQLDGIFIGASQTKEIRNIISIDSRDRDFIKYTKPNFFEISLGKTFPRIRYLGWCGECCFLRTSRRATCAAGAGVRSGAV